MKEAHQERYAQILVEHAVALRPGQRLDVHGELIHRNFALRIGKAAYAAGAGQVCYRLPDPRETAQLIRHGKPEQIVLKLLELRGWLDDLLRAGGALVFLHGKGDPDLLPGLARSHPRNHRLYAHETSLVSVDFTRRVADQHLAPSVAAVYPTPGWARRVFPHLDEEEAFDRLSQLVARFTFADRSDGLARAETEARRLEARAAALDRLALRELRVRGGGNDLLVGLSARSRWRAPTFVTSSGQRFVANVPSFEVFTTPDWRTVEGRLVTTRPLHLPGGEIVEGLVLDFDGGRVVDFSAERGAAAFSRWLDAEEGTRHLGEFALVGHDSPIAESGVVFQHSCLDENAAAHVALGQAYAEALAGGDKMMPEELDAVGCNRSHAHLDVAFGSAAVDVTATGSAEVVVLRGGLWTEALGGDGTAGPSPVAAPCE